MRRRNTKGTPLASINVTSLLDITFVLLIAFMVVAPAMKHGIDLQLPQVVDAPPMQEEKSISIVVKPELTGSGIYVNGQEVMLDEVVPRVVSIAGENTTPVVTLEGDRAANWETVVQVIAALRSSGISRIGIQTTLPPQA